MSTGRVGTHASAALPEVPLTMEGASVLHQMFRVKWAQWRELPEDKRHAIAAEASKALAEIEHGGPFGSAVFSLLGHKGDLLLIHFRKNFDELNAAELRLRTLRLWNYLEETHSYLSVVELGLYESTS